MNLQEFNENLEQYNVLKAELKQRSMIYQVEAKETLAKFFRLPLDYFYHFSYVDFCENYKIYKRVIDLMCKYRKEMNSFYNLPEDTFFEVAFKYWMTSFLDYYYQVSGEDLRQQYRKTS